MRVIAYSNKGPVRKNNEDAIFVAGNIISGCSISFPIEINTEKHNNSFVVIDGMGGYEGGEKAAFIVASSFVEANGNWNIPTSSAKNKINLILNNAVKRIIEAAEDNPELSNMGAALAGVIVCSESILIFNCGDCRIYRQQGGYLEKISHDHSIVQELFDNGEIEEDDMRTNAKKNTITACVSSRISDLNIYFREFSYGQQQTRLFICSDGVWEALPIDELEKCLHESSLETANNIVKKLFSLQEHCSDNISFIIVGN